jgi:GxxExxY protein
MDRSPAGDLAHAELTSRIIAVFYEVFRDLGYGFSERIYSRALAIALEQEGMEVWREPPIAVHFRGRRIGDFYPDLVVDRIVLIEVKAMPMIEGHATSQILNYLKAAGGGLGYILNFGRQPQFKRFVMGDPSNSLPLFAGNAARETAKRG